MQNLRPTFHESWYKIKDIKPRLRTGIETHRQVYNGNIWFTLSDPANNNHFRANETSHYFISLLNGERTVEMAWEMAQEVYNDYAPTQGEVLRILGELYSSNLLRGDLSVDVQGMFSRYKKRRFREISATLSNILFLKYPLIDPDKFLTEWAKAFSWIFTKTGFMLWLCLIILAFSQLAGNWTSLFSKSENIFDPGNLLLLYITFAGLKGVHELAHGFACKILGLQEGTTGEVHKVGVMLLLLTPVPYVDATSSWAFKSKWRRIVVAGAGVYAELAVAAVMAIVWANVGEGETVRAICYNAMFIASVSTILFNLNPLLKFDGYYIIVDLFEMPNLAQRSREYLYYLVKNKIWGIKHIHSVAYTLREKIVFPLYTISAALYRIGLSLSILYFVGNELLFFGVIFAVMFIFMWVVMPVYKFFKYLILSSELSRNRFRAIFITCACMLICFYVLGVMRWQDRFVAEAVVEPSQRMLVYSNSDGYLSEITSTDREVKKGETLYRQLNPELLSKVEQLEGSEQEYEVRRRLALRKNDLTEAAIHAEQLVSIRQRMMETKKDYSELIMLAPFDGQWIAPRLDYQAGKFIKRGELLGVLQEVDRMKFRVVINQSEAARLFLENDYTLSYRINNRGDLPGGEGLKGELIPAGSRRLPAASLGFAGGGELSVDTSEETGSVTTEKFFELYIANDGHAANSYVLPGVRLRVRFDFQEKPLFTQYYRKMVQLFHKRFNR